jgi:hypothetical protein
MQSEGGALSPLANIGHAVSLEHTQSEHARRDKKEELFKPLPSGVSTQDTQRVAFLKWALPKLHMRWAGFRKVHRTVCKRVNCRLSRLGLPDTFAYRDYLETHPEELVLLDDLCWTPL